MNVDILIRIMMAGGKKWDDYADDADDDDDNDDKDQNTCCYRPIINREN